MKELKPNFQFSPAEKRIISRKASEEEKSKYYRKMKLITILLQIGLFMVIFIALWRSYSLISGDFQWSTAIQAISSFIITGLYIFLLRYLGKELGYMQKATSIK